MTMIPDVAYLILNYNPDGEVIAQEILGATLDAFYTRKSRHLTCDVVLLDQGTDAEHRRWLLEKQEQYGFSSIFMNRNIGISRAINYRVRTSKSPVIGLITSDVMMTRGMDEDLFEKVLIPEVYQATPFTDKSDVDFQVWKPAGVPYGSERVDLDQLRKAKTSVWNKMFGHPPNYIRCICLEFNIMFWRRDIFGKVGYYDERWRASYENNDFSLRCFLAGGCTALSLDSFVWHYHKVTEKNDSKEKSHDGYLLDWRTETRRMWDEKWPNVENEIPYYKLLKNKTINDYPAFYEKFKQNIYLPYEQNIDYF